MSCYHPLVAYPDLKPTKNGKVSYRIIGTLKDNYSSSLDLDQDGILIPCGKCLGCRLDYSRSWADRMMLELSEKKKAIFVTLTYDNDHVPFTEDDNGEFGWLTLDKRDLQLFFKRLRKHFSDKEVRYYASGEYGSNTLRPHYHAIIFGLEIEDFPDRLLHGRNELGQRHFTSRTLERIWSNGFIVLAEVNWQTCAYVSRYVQKKVFHGMQYSDFFGVVPEFSLMSRRPGIASSYFDKHQHIVDESKIYINGVPDGMKVPKYFLKKLQLISPEQYDMLMEERKQFAKDFELLKSQQSDLSTVERLEQAENEKIWKLSALRRNLNG